jgi:hypothetical protein
VRSNTVSWYHAALVLLKGLTNGTNGVLVFLGCGVIDRLTPAPSPTPSAIKRQRKWQGLLLKKQSAKQWHTFNVMATRSLFSPR